MIHKDIKNYKGTPKGGDLSPRKSTHKIFILGKSKMMQNDMFMLLI